MTEFDPELANEGDVPPQEAEPFPTRGNRLEAETLMRPLQSLMREKVAKISPEATVAEASTIMADGHFGCVLVEKDGRLVGIFSERDVVTRVVRHRKDPMRELVGTHMTPDPETLRPKDPVAYALNLMSTGGFRHVPITQKDGSVAGIVSLRDVGRLVVEHFREEILTLPPDPVKNTRASTRHGG